MLVGERGSVRAFFSHVLSDRWEFVRVCYVCAEASLEVAPEFREIRRFKSFRRYVPQREWFFARICSSNVFFFW